MTRRDRDLLEVQVPAAATRGDHPVMAKNGALTATFARRFVVDAAAPPAPTPPPPVPTPPPAPTPPVTVAVTGFQPRTVEHGGTIELQGTGLKMTSRILVNGRQLPVTKADPSGTRLWVIVPNTVVGEHPIEVVEGKHRARSVAKVQIVEEAGRAVGKPIDNRSGAPR